MAEKHVVAKVADFADTDRKLVEVKGRPIVIFKLGEEWFGMLNRCPHQGGSLCAGHLISQVDSDRPGDYRLSRRGEILRCPWHGWEFDIRTGEACARPGKFRARPVGVSVLSADDTETVGDLELYDVSTEADLVVVEL
ncbi:Rieske (2Fe-2S) protein [Pseudooceanicola sp.]|uniref:Rieske (2Fe-2S) protein n=1 Tax=Pseudooceanicola sp. TaxID=1914328 RepID=UPI00261C4463|nr:Rieske (2Fe-2S) protein [Pseudooceanicola sp.]MDF1856180.1 Rieske (2Fe-2S) protein [Pseudooceanicola sp.]